jgi:hypothetical protein
MPTQHAVRRTFLATALLASMLSLPQAARADDDKAARAAAANDPRYSWAALRKMKPMEVMHMVDEDKKGYVTKEEFMKFQEQFFDRMDRDHDGKISAQEWMGGKAGKK